MTRPTVKFFTLGCKVNQYDTQSIRQRFLDAGFLEAQRGENPADYVLVNTCTVTSSADRKSRHIIRNCIKTNPRARVIVTGCLVKKDWMSLSRIKGIGVLVDKGFFAEGIRAFSAHTRAFLKVQDGCSNGCAYCKVPLVRGVSRSRPAASVVKEARQLVKSGYKEIVLTGICLGSYGRDLGAKESLAGLISVLEKIPGLLRLRLSSIEAGDIGAGLIAKISDSGILCPHLHIPIQSGDDKILRLMRRGYSAKFYLELVRRLRKKVAGLAISTDCLVGFPGETRSNFHNTVKLLREIEPLKTHIFPFSPRPGTPAEKLAGRLDNRIIRQRIKELEQVAAAAALSFRKRFINREAPVLVEEKCNNAWEGFTPNYVRVSIDSSVALAGKLVRVKLRDCYSYLMHGDYIDTLWG